jgi:hypothetical protein
MLGVLDQTTVYAPLNTVIDGDRDYHDLRGLGRCNCGYEGLSAADGANKPLLVLATLALGWFLWAGAGSPGRR